MRIFAGNRNDDSVGIEYNDVEILCDEQELSVLIGALVKFKEEIDVYKRNKTPSGVTHMHYRDNDPNWTNSDADMVIYVKLSEE